MAKQTSINVNPRLVPRRQQRSRKLETHATGRKVADAIRVFVKAAERKTALSAESNPHHIVKIQTSIYVVEEGEIRAEET
jgi:hypothetical protein